MSKCIVCGGKEKKSWVEIGLGHKRLVYSCHDNQKKNIATGYKGFKEPVAFGYDTKTGRPLAMDKKGRKFDPAETRYNLDKDPYGWGATGKVKPKKTYII